MGNKNSGRRPISKEWQDAKEFWHFWTTPFDTDKFEREEISTGKVTPEKMFWYRCAQGEIKCLVVAAKKAYPDKIEHSGDEENPIRLIKVLKLGDGDDYKTSPDAI